MTKKKSEISVYDATKLAYYQMDSIFHAIILVANVRILLHRPAVMDGSIMRRLRQLRLNGEINYRIRNNELAIYEKIAIKPTA